MVVRRRALPSIAIAAIVLAAASCGDGSSSDELLLLVADTDLPGAANRFDYQDVDPALGHLVVAHMNDASVVVVDLADGSVVKVLDGIPTPRGIAVADDAGRIFVTSSPSTLVIIDNQSLEEIDRVGTGNAPDGVAWDPVDSIVAVSDQRDGAVSLIAGGGSGPRTQVPLGDEVGNVVFDASRGWFWITVVTSDSPDRLIGIDPAAAEATTQIDIPGCNGAHGLRLHPDGRSAFVACEDNDTLARVPLDESGSVVTASTGSGPDVLAIDPGLGWLYVAAESGDLTVFDIGEPDLATIDSGHPGDHAHSVAVDAATHRVFFPLESGPEGKPVLRIMEPKATE